jgi:hypothetical protein
MEATFCSLYQDDLASLKTSALYFDKIILPADGGVIGPIEFDQKLKRPPRMGDKGVLKVAASYWTRPARIERAVQPLVDEGVVVLAEPSDYDLATNSAFSDAFDKKVSTLPKEQDGRVFIEFNPDLFLVSQADVDIGSVRYVYSGILRSAFFESERYNSPILTDTMMLNDILSQFVNGKLRHLHGKAKAKSGFLAHRVLTEMLPNIGDAEFDEILEVRTRFKDDLADLRAAMSKLSGSIRAHPWSHEIEDEVDRIV